jgi:quercetin dioxygenase-like cupin family protein
MSFTVLRTNLDADPNGLGIERRGGRRVTAWEELVGGIVARLSGHSSAASFLPHLADVAGEVPMPCVERNALLPVQRYWPAAGSGDALGQALATVDAQIGAGWRQNPNYRANPPSAGFLDNYGYLECVGPEAPVPTDNLRLGLLLLGPATLYPPHQHPAEEIYLPLGPGRWWRAGDSWRELTAGAVIHHPPLCGHATESGAEALAAIYLWRGAIARAAEIV